MVVVRSDAPCIALGDFNSPDDATPIVREWWGSPVTLHMDEKGYWWEDSYTGSVVAEHNFES